ncbi:glycosyltransferase [Nitriliruptoria bacterium AS10]|nr:glycosyltransferase [Salsipaludibacter albus]
MMAGLAERGWSVSELNAPLDLSTSGRVEIMKRPWKAVPAVWEMLTCWRDLVRGRHDMPDPDVVVVGYFGYLDVHLAKLLFPDALVVLDDTAPLVDTVVDRSLDAGPASSVVGLVERAAIGRSDLVVADTLEHLRTDTASVVVSVGADDAWFDAATDSRDDGPMRVVFYGLFTPLHGTRVIAQAITRVTEDMSFTLVGHGQELDAVLDLVGERPEVEHVAWVDMSGLPDLVGRHDVCLGIFGTTPKAQRVVPNKVVQGMAAGCVMVTSDTPPQRRMVADGAILVEPGDPDALARALDELARDPEARATHRARAATVARDRFRPTPVTEELDVTLHHLLGRAP